LFETFDPTVSNINIKFQTNLQTLFDDLGWNKYVTNNVSKNASVVQIHLEFFSYKSFLRG